MSSWLSVKGSLGIDEWEQSILQLSNEDEVASPVSSRLDSKDINIFGLAPLSTETVVVTCNHCSRPTLQSSFLQHLENCQKIQMKETKITSKSSTSNAAAVTSVANSTPSTSNPAPTVKTKKRKLQSDGDKPLKKSASEKPEKSKSGKAKVPLDLDRHCGVPLGTGVCMRAITCKNHSVAAKRAVEGRSQGYDILVQLYQSRMAQEKKDRLAAQEAANTKVESPQQVIQLETLDPDTEAVAVYEAIKFYQATPLATKPRSLVKHRHMSSSIETLREALAKKSVKVSAG